MGEQYLKVRVDENYCTSRGVSLRLECGLFPPEIMRGHTEYIDTDAISRVALAASFDCFVFSVKLKVRILADSKNRGGVQGLKRE